MLEALAENMKSIAAGLRSELGLVSTPAPSRGGLSKDQRAKIVARTRKVCTYSK